MTYPGETFVTAHGYTLYSTSGNYDKATYIKDGIFLTVRARLRLKDGELELFGTLERVIGMVRCTIDEFSIPNSNFEKFEEQICSLYSPLEK
jgi:hypothetical protein